MTDNITLPRSVVEQALEALNPTASGNWTSTIALNAEAAIHALRAALEQPQVEQEPTPNGATHRQPKQGAFYKRVDGKWYVWSRMENGGSHRWYISPGTTESCLDPIYTHPQPKRQPLTDAEILMVLDAADIPDLPRDFKDVDIDIARAIERAHGIGGGA